MTQILQAHTQHSCREGSYVKEAIVRMSHLKVSRIIVKSTNFPSNGTTREVGGMISARRRKKTVSERRMLMDRDTWDTRMILERAK